MAILMHQNIPVAQVTNNGQHILSIINKNELPVGVYSNNMILLDNLYNNWLTTRTIPNIRQNISIIQQKLRMPITEAQVKSMFVSLTDCFWIKPNDLNIKWENVNYYDNGFSEELFENLPDALSEA